MSTTPNRELHDAIAREENRDPISGAPGAHPIGTGVGAVLGGAAVGAAAGTVVGPVGTVVGTAVGAVVGGLAGKGIAEAIDPTRELAYWQRNHETRPYADEGGTFDEYGPAYAYGAASFTKHRGHSFKDVETDLSRDWVASRGKSTLEWDRARPAAQDAWDRVSTGS